MLETPKISIVMATYNRAETLQETIRCLEHQTLDPRFYEALIVNDGSSDNTEDVVLAALPRVAFTLRYFSHVNRGPGYTQNHGIVQAKAPIILLTADDILLTPGALHAHLVTHLQNPAIEVAVLGRVLQSPKLNQSVFLRTWDPFRFKDLERIRELPYYMFWACNISFKRDFMLLHGMFQEQVGRAGPAAHEDVELGYRLGQHGLRILYNKDASGYHYHPETIEGAIQRAYQRGLNWGEFKERVPTPEVTVKYHVLNSRTIREHLSALAGQRRRYLLGPDRNVFLLFSRYLLRFLIFNRVTVPYLWLRVLSLAEHMSLLAKCMHRNFYRGVISYHFFKGCRDGDRKFGSPKQTGTLRQRCTTGLDR